MFRRSILLLPVLLTGLALPAAALAGEDDGDGPTLDQPRNCVSDSRAKATVTGDDIASVAFFVDGNLVKTATRPTVRGTYVFAPRCSSFSVGAHRARAVVTSTSGSERTTLRFQIARSAQASPRFTG